MRRAFVVRYSEHFWKAYTDNDTTSATLQTAESVAASSDTSDCCEVCLLQKREDVALGRGRAGILDSVAVAQSAQTRSQKKGDITQQHIDIWRCVAG